MGGIGAVLDGLLGSPAYNSRVGRTLLAGPIDADDHALMERRTAPANRFTIARSTVHGVHDASAEVESALGQLEERMNVRFVYGRRWFGNFEHEVLLVDAVHVRVEISNSLKYYLWRRWGLASDRYDAVAEYRFHLDAAEPLYSALIALCGGADPGAERYLVAHEWVGLPLVLRAAMSDEGKWRKIFYAHEVATARMLVEAHGGHDTRFYNALRLAKQKGLVLDDVYGDHSWFHKHAVIQRAGVCDRIFAVGQGVMDELRFLGGAVGSTPIDLVYNGAPDAAVTLPEKLRSRELLLSYAEELLGYRPDYIFTHVTRLVTSKAIWRDFRVLEHLDGRLAADRKSAVYLLVASATPGGKSSSDVVRWEAEYGWPLGHRGDNGDLVGEETRAFFHLVEPFRTERSAIRAVLVNQFGWERGRCGTKMPAEMALRDLRIGSDLEFGQSIYEPFGIAQLETLSGGGLSVVSSVCGCVGFVHAAAGSHEHANVIVGDYVTVSPERRVDSLWDALAIDQRARDVIEFRESGAVAQTILARLPHDYDDRARLLASGQALASSMSWQVVARDYFLPALARCR
jgi:hypothetical protein